MTGRVKVFLIVEDFDFKSSFGIEIATFSGSNDSTFA